jgi:putative acetyltransferase
LAVIDIGLEDPDQPEIRALLQMSDDYMAGLYPAESNHLLDIASLQRPEVSFLVARVDGRALGCGAYVNSPEGWGEIKRMFVSPEARGQRLGRRLLLEIERLAILHGARWLRLETGAKQPEALALYRSAGFVDTGPFGSYKADPLSLFMEKPLPAAPAK